jgi:hypothetical protein
VIDRAADLLVPKAPLQTEDVVETQVDERQDRPLIATEVETAYVPKLRPETVNGDDPSVGTFRGLAYVGLGAS